MTSQFCHWNHDNQKVDIKHDMIKNKIQCIYLYWINSSIYMWFQSKLVKLNTTKSKTKMVWNSNCKWRWHSNAKLKSFFIFTVKSGLLICLISVNCLPPCVELPCPMVKLVTRGQTSWHWWEMVGFQVIAVGNSQFHNGHFKLIYIVETKFQKKVLKIKNKQIRK